MVLVRELNTEELELVNGSGMNYVPNPIRDMIERWIFDYKIISRKPKEKVFEIIRKRLNRRYMGDLLDREILEECFEECWDRCRLIS